MSRAKTALNFFGTGEKNLREDELGKSGSSKSGRPSGKPKKPKKLKAQQAQAPPAQEAFQPQTQPRSRRRLGEILANNPVVVMVSLFAAVVSLIWIKGSPSPAIEPEIRAASDAYPSSFTIYNKSGWYEITDLEAMCRQGKVDYGDPKKDVGENYFFRNFKLGTAIAPRDHATFPCLGIPNLGPAISGTIDLVIAYHVRWHSIIIGQPHIIRAKETYSQGKWIDGPII